MLKHKKNTRFVSDMDLFSAEFAKTHPLSASQRAEEAKYKAIYKLRDFPGSAGGLPAKETAPSPRVGEGAEGR